MKMFFVRHGESVANSANIVSPLDTNLTKKGMEQSIALGCVLKNKKITKIVSSPLIRARQTAEIIAETIKIPENKILFIKELEEKRLGKLEGLPRIHNVEYYYKTENEYGLEPQNNLIKRMKVALQKISEISKYEKGNVVIVGHCVSGFYLTQVAKGRYKYSDFEPIKYFNNTEIIEISLTE
jgi:broad specificity phosphatase PhoE